MAIGLMFPRARNLFRLVAPRLSRPDRRVLLRLLRSLGADVLRAGLPLRGVGARLARGVRRGRRRVRECTRDCERRSLSQRTARRMSTARSVYSVYDKARTVTSVRNGWNVNCGSLCPGCLFLLGPLAGWMLVSLVNAGPVLRAPCRGTGCVGLRDVNGLLDRVLTVARSPGWDGPLGTFNFCSCPAVVGTLALLLVARTVWTGRAL